MGDSSARLGSTLHMRGHGCALFLKSQFARYFSLYCDGAHSAANAMDDPSSNLGFCCQSSALATETSMGGLSAAIATAVDATLFGGPVSMEDELAAWLRFSTVPRQRYFESAVASSQSIVAPATSASAS